MKLKRKPLQPKGKPVQGKVHIIEDRCKGCLYCIELCPTQVLEEAKHFNAKGYHPPVAAREELCVNCQVCFMICPEFAIYSTRVDERAEAAGEVEPGADEQAVGAEQAVVGAAKG